MKQKEIDVCSRREREMEGVWREIGINLYVLTRTDTLEEIFAFLDRRDI